MVGFVAAVVEVAMGAQVRADRQRPVAEAGEGRLSRVMTRQTSTQWTQTETVSPQSETVRGTSATTPAEHYRAVSKKRVFPIIAPPTQLSKDA